MMIVFLLIVLCFQTAVESLQKYRRWYMLCFKEVLLRNRVHHVVLAVPAVPHHSRAGGGGL